MTIYLYIKQHSITGLKYFGKTINDPFTYDGSGTHWKNHINKHGREHIKTLHVYKFNDQEAATEFALKFSIDNDIVESLEWANQVPENALDSWNNHDKFRGKTYEEIYGLEKATVLKLLRSENNPGKNMTIDTKIKISTTRKQKLQSGEIVNNFSESWLRQQKLPFPVVERVTCEHCGLSCTKGNHTRWHGIKCKNYSHSFHYE